MHNLLLTVNIVEIYPGSGLIISSSVPTRIQCISLLVEDSHLMIFLRFWTDTDSTRFYTGVSKFGET